MSSRHGSQESLRHYNTMGSMSMLQTPTGQTSREAATAAAVAAQKKKGIKSSLGRFFSKKEKVSGELFYLWLLIITVTPFASYRWRAWRTRCLTGRPAWCRWAKYRWATSNRTTTRWAYPGDGYRASRAPCPHPSTTAGRRRSKWLNKLAGH